MGCRRFSPTLDVTASKEELNQSCSAEAVKLFDAMSDSSGQPHVATFASYSGVEPD